MNIVLQRCLCRRLSPAIKVSSTAYKSFIQLDFFPLTHQFEIVARYGSTEGRYVTVSGKAC